MLFPLTFCPDWYPNKIFFSPSLFSPAKLPIIILANFSELFSTPYPDLYPILTDSVNLLFLPDSAPINVFLPIDVLLAYPELLPKNVLPSLDCKLDSLKNPEKSPRNKFLDKTL